MVKLRKRVFGMYQRFVIWFLIAAAVILVPAGTASANLTAVDADEVSQQIVDVVSEIVTPLGALVIFCVIAYTAFQLITSANNPSKRAEVMESIPYILGGGIALGGVMLFAGLVIGIMNKVSG